MLVAYVHDVAFARCKFRKKERKTSEISCLNLQHLEILHARERSIAGHRNRNVLENTIAGETDDPGMPQDIEVMVKVPGGIGMCLMLLI